MFRSCVCCVVDGLCSIDVCVVCDACVVCVVYMFVCLPVWSV